MEAAGPEAPSDGSNNALKIGGVLLGIAAIVFIISQVTDGSDEDVNTAACSLGVSGITTITVGFSRGESARAIIAAAGPTLGSLACKGFVNTLADDPTEPVNYELEAADGTVLSQAVSQSDLISPPSPPPAESTPRIISCLHWSGAYLYRLCVNGFINPPAAPAPQGGYP